MKCESCYKTCKDNAYKPYCTYNCFIYEKYYGKEIILKYLESINDKILYIKTKLKFFDNHTKDVVNLTEPSEMLDFLQRIEQRFNLKGKHIRGIKTGTLIDLAKIHIKTDISGKQILALNRARRSDEYYRRG